MSTRGGEGGRGFPEIRKIAKPREEISGETQKTTPGTALPSRHIPEARFQRLTKLTVTDPPLQDKNFKKSSPYK